MNFVGRIFSPPKQQPVFDCGNMAYVKQTRTAIRRIYYVHFCKFDKIMLNTNGLMMSQVMICAFLHIIK